MEWLEWLIHSLEEKQIAESVSKITDCERWNGETTFALQFEPATNVLPQHLSEGELRRLTRWLLQLLAEIEQRIDNKEVVYEGDNAPLREQKLR